MQNKQQVFVLMSKAQMPDSSTICNVAGVFDDESSAMDFTEQVICGITYGDNHRSFHIFAAQDPSGKNRKNFVFSYEQEQRSLFPVLSWECTCEVILSKNNKTS